MKFYHSTTEESANRIVETKHMRASRFKLWDFLDWWMSCLEYLEDYGELPPIPERYPKGRRELLYIFTLGEGIYCFKEKDIEVARNYSQEHNAIIEIQTRDSSIFSFYNNEEKRIIVNFFENEFKLFLDSRNFTEKEIETYELIKLILLDSLHEDFKMFPQAAGIILEIYNNLADEPVQIASNYIYKFNDILNKDEKYEYVVIKNSDIITDYSRIE